MLWLIADLQIYILRTDQFVFILVYLSSRLSVAPICIAFLTIIIDKSSVGIFLSDIHLRVINIVISLLFA